MPRNMSFSMTTKQIRTYTKTVTRRLGWWFLRPGVRVWAVEQVMGLKKGEHVRRICLLEIVSVCAMPLNAITADDCAREGFPNMSPADFVSMFCAHHDCSEDAMVNRIEFRYVDDSAGI